jgi:hypothetical protein
MTALRTPSPFQERVLAVPETINLALLGGRGGGKSTALLYLVIRYATQYGISARVLILRETLESTAQLLEDATALFAAALPGSITNKADRTIRTPQGAFIKFSNINEQAAIAKLQGQSFSFIICDEITNLPTLKYYNQTKANLRGPTHVPLRLVIVGNPGGPSHQVIASTYVDGRFPGVPFTLDDGTRWVYLPSTFHDNPYINQDKYLVTLRAAAGGDPGLFEAWANGSFSAVGGSFFGSSYGPHNLFEDDPSWRVPRTDPILRRHYGTTNPWRSFIAGDYGQTAPTYVGLFACPIAPGLSGPGGRVFPANSLLLLEEFTTADPSDPNKGIFHTPQMIAEEVLWRCERRSVRPFGVFDNAMGLQPGDDLIQQLNRAGLSVTPPATKRRIDGWIKMRSMLESSKDPEKPALYISSSCTYLHSTLPLLPRNKMRSEDVDTNAADHAADAVRYAVSSTSYYRQMPTRVIGV